MNKNKENENNSRFFHSVVSYLAGVFDTHERFRQLCHGQQTTLNSHIPTGLHHRQICLQAFKTFLKSFCKFDHFSAKQSYNFKRQNHSFHLNFPRMINTNKNLWLKVSMKSYAMKAGKYNDNQPNVNFYIQHVLINVQLVILDQPQQFSLQF